jgi:hypothetical protein
VMYFDEKAGISKVWISINADGKKTRILKKTQKAIA